MAIVCLFFCCFLWKISFSPKKEEQFWKATNEKQRKIGQVFDWKEGKSWTDFWLYSIYIYIHEVSQLKSSSQSRFWPQMSQLEILVELFSENVISHSCKTVFGITIESISVFRVVECHLPTKVADCQMLHSSPHQSGRSDCQQALLLLDDPGASSDVDYCISGPCGCSNAYFIEYSFCTDLLINVPLPMPCSAGCIDSSGRFDCKTQSHWGFGRLSTLRMSRDQWLCQQQWLAVSYSDSRRMLVSLAFIISCIQGLCPKSSVEKQRWRRQDRGLLPEICCRAAFMISLRWGSGSG